MFGWRARAMNKVRGRPFEPGNTLGRGRPKGSRNKSKSPGQDLFDEYGEHLIRKIISLGLMGDTNALRICMDRVSPARRDAVIPSAFLCLVQDLPPRMGGFLASTRAGSQGNGVGEICRESSLPDVCRKAGHSRTSTKARPADCYRGNSAMTDADRAAFQAWATKAGYRLYDHRGFNKAAEDAWQAAKDHYAPRLTAADAVEVVAKAIHHTPYTIPWDYSAVQARENARDKAKAALRAAGVKFREGP